LIIEITIDQHIAVISEKHNVRSFKWFLTGGTRTTWGYEEPKQGVRSTKDFRDTRSGNLNQILLNIHRDSL